MGEEELNNVKEAFATNWISPAGPFLQQFEAAIKTRCRVTDAAAIQSGTAGIHLALRLLDIQPGEVVLCQSFTFIASCNPILYERAEPVFIDSEKETWNMCPIALEAIVHSQTGQKTQSHHRCSSLRDAGQYARHSGRCRKTPATDHRRRCRGIGSHLSRQSMWLHG